MKESKRSTNGVMASKEAEVLKQLVNIMTGKDDTVNKALVHYHKKQIISIPETMTKLEAASELERQYNEEEMEIDVDRKFAGWKWQDVLVAIKLTAEEYFGWIDAKRSFMNPPTEIQIIIDYVNGRAVKTTCFHGEFGVASLDEAVCNIGVQAGIAMVSFNVKKKYKAKIEQWFELIDQHLREKSIYKGKSVSVSRGGDDENGFGDTVQFDIIETGSNPMIVLNAKERSVLQQYCKLDLHEKGKRTYLFTGNYGNGKTEAAMMLGDEAKKLGMTFFYVKDSDAFTSLLRIAAKNYSPCLIFMEDIDEIGSGTERTGEINVLLNTLDGAETKNKDIKVLFTTNHHKQIAPALRRPGRLDLIVKFENPETDTVEKIYRIFFENIEGGQELNYQWLAEQTPDCSGAFVAEICKRSVRLAKINNEITDDIVVAAANTIKDHLELMNEEVEQKDKLQEAVTILGKHMNSGVAQANIGDVVRNEISPVKSLVNAVHGDLKNHIGSAATTTNKKLDVVAGRAGDIKEMTKEIHQATV